MTKENKDILLRLLQQHKELGISEQIDYQKFYLYSIITHSTAIEGSTVTEVEAQLLFDEGITSSKRTMMEQQMNLDLKAAYDYGMQWIKQHEDITVDWLVLLASKVMARTGSEYHAAGGDFSAAKGELRKLNVTAGLGGKSYMSYLKVPSRLETFCEELNRRRKSIDVRDVAAIYDLSFWAHFELVTIHPWADGNGRMARLIMNHIQFEFGLVPSKVLKEDKGDYINALIATREDDNMSHFTDFMAEEMIKTLSMDIESFLKSTQESGEKTENSGKKKLKSREKILALLKEHSEYSARKLAEEIGITPKAVEKQLANLKASGLIRREGPDKGGKWIIS